MSAAFGRSSSFMISLMMSASGCSRPVGPDQVRAVALLDERRDLALHVDEDRRRDQQREEDHDDDDELRDELGRDEASSISAPPSRGARAIATAPAPCSGPRGCALRIRRGTCLTVESTGVAAASPNAQSVLPRMLLATDSSRSRSLHLRPRRARSCRGCGAASRRLRGTACTCRTTRACRSAAGSPPPTPCTSSRP